MIDIGGPSLIRASSKNFKYITTICHKKYYKSLITNLNKNNGITVIGPAIINMNIKVGFENAKSFKLFFVIK